MKIADVMQKGVLSVSPELPVRNLEEFLTSEDISGVPVLDNAGRAVGLASKTDIVRASSEQAVSREMDILDPDLTVADIMTRDVQTVGPDAEVAEVAQMMVDGHMHRVLVVDDDEVVGIVTSFDLLKLIR